jgi:pimeloyl-ACP methyl ester carboxylesterase
MNEHDEPGQEEQSMSGANEYAGLLEEIQASRQEFAGRLEPSPETDQFKEEIKTPRMVEDPESGVNYAVYELNRDKQGTPLVVNLAWSVPAGTGVGRADVNEFAQHIDRPIKVIDMEATGQTGIPDRAARKAATFESLAASHLRVIDQLGVDKFDIAGYSLGGVMATEIAAQAGDRVSNVVTMAAPGFEDISMVELGRGFVLKEGENAKTYREDAAELRPTILEQDKAAQADTKGTVTLKNAPMLIKLAGLMTKEAAAEAVGRLSPDTKWTDIVGSQDPVTAWTGHLEAVRERNARYPRSSAEHVLGGETHGMGMHRPAMAEVVAITLAKIPNKQQSPGR